MSDNDGPDLSCFDFGDSDDEAGAGEQKQPQKQKQKQPQQKQPQAQQDSAQLLKAHRQEEQRLRTEAKAKKHAIPKGDRAARDKADAELEEVLRQMEARHAEELGAAPPGPEAAVAKLSLSDGAAPKKGKSGKKRNKKEDEERARERRMEEQRAGAGPSLRDVEMGKLRSKLAPLGLDVHEIAADGHCLYRSLAHQLQLAGEADADFADCRKAAAQYIRTHPQEFLPYLIGEAPDDAPDAQFLDKYCAQVEGSSEWGGQLEITAISHARRRCIAVHTAEAPVVLTGTEYDGNGPRLQLAYHLHHYGLGEHYNSLVPADG